MNEAESSQNSSLTLAIRAQKTPIHKRLGFHTAFGTEWFEFSPMKMKEYFYEVATNINNQSYLNDISFSTVLDMSSLNINEIEDHVVFGSDLPAILDCKAKDEARLDMLRTVCLPVLKDAKYELLRHQVITLVEADLSAANITWRPEENLYLKVRLYRVTSLHTFPS
jgi:hypothetical protein